MLPACTVMLFTARELLLVVIVGILFWALVAYGLYRLAEWAL